MKNMRSFELKPDSFRLPRAPVGALIFCFFFLIYAVTIHGQLRYGDETERYLQAQSLVERQSFEIRQVPGHQTLAPDGKNYSQFEMGYGILLVPPYWIGKLANEFLAYPEQDWIPLLFVFFVNPVITALTCVVLFWFGRALGVDQALAFLITLLFGIATMALPYTKGLYREPVLGLTLLLAVYAMYRFRQSGQTRWFWIAAICLGYSAFTKVANAMMLPLFGLYLLFALKGREGAWNFRSVVWWRQAGFKLIAFVLPTLVLLGMQGVVNLLKYKNVFVIGPENYRDPLPYFSLAYVPGGVLGFLFSPEKSLFLYSPPTILYLIAWIPFFRKDRLEAIFSLAVISVNVLFNSAYQLWGSVNWGPRYLLLIVPLLILPIGILIQAASGWKRWLWLGLSVLTGLAGLGVQGIAALIDDREFLGVVPTSGNLAMAFDLLKHRTIDSLVIFLSPESNRVHLNPWLGVSFILIGFVGVVLIARLRQSKDEVRPFIWTTWRVPLIVLLVQLGAFWIWIIADYSTILQLKADTKYVAANNYFAEGRSVEAYSLYARAMYQGTAYATESKARMKEIQPRASGSEVELGDLGAHVMTQDTAQVTDDAAVSLSGVASLRISTPPGKEASVESDTEFLAVLPNTQYELSGWLKTEGMYGMGYAFIGWYEDNGKWQQSHTENIFNGSESGGWRLFRQIFTTLPTTKRMLLKTGLWQVQGTLWVDDVHLIQVTAAVGDPTSRP